MSDHKDRMIKEFKQLDIKIGKLNTFIHSNPLFKDIGDLEQAKMIKQVGFMESYKSILDSRIWTAK